MTRAHRRRPEWGSYLARFHAARPGITEEILSQASSGQGNPYQWLAEMLPPEARVLDVACGSAPIHGHVGHGAWVGIDRSSQELERARSRGAGPVIQGDISRLPFRDRSFDVVICAMALMLFEPLPQCLTEIARVVAPEGTIAVLLPAAPRPLNGSDVGRWARLLFTLRTVRLNYPNDPSMRSLTATVQRLGFEVLADERRRFSFHVANTEAADRFVDSLYLPDAEPGRVEAARRVARSWVGEEIGIPLRRVHMVKQRVVFRR
jgi:SAM-dependent methyltransferase